MIEMKKVLLLFFMALLVIFVVNAKEIMPIGTTPVPLITSADQYYSVMFDEEGEAIVSLRLTINNADDVAISSVNLEIPGNMVTLYGVLQETSGYEKKSCISYSYGCLEYGEGQTCVQYDYDGDCVEYERPCLKQGQVCDRYSTSYINDRIYQRLDVEPIKLSNSYSVPIELESVVQPNGQTNLLIVYKAAGYVDKAIGAYNFEFETSKVSYMTNNVRVAINVQQNLYLKGTKAEINYQPSFGMFSKAMAAQEMTADQSREISQYSNQLTYISGLVKTASYLDPYESFSVNGVYSKSWARLYWGRIVWITLISLAIIAFLVFSARKLTKYARENIPAKVEKKQSESKHNFVIPFLAGLFTSIAMTMIWVIAIFIIQAVGSMLRYGMGELLGVLIILFVILLNLALLIGIPIYMGSRFGALMGLFTILSILGWLFIFAIIIIIVAALFFQRTVYF